MATGRSGRLRRAMISTPASTRGIGRNPVAGIRGPSRNSHHGAHVVDSIVEGGIAARLRATSHCTTTSARSSGTVGLSRRWRRMLVVCPNGRDPITLNGRVGRRTHPHETQRRRLGGQRAQGEGSSGRDGGVARPGASADRRTLRITIVTMGTIYGEWRQDRNEVSAGGNCPGARQARAVGGPSPKEAAKGPT
jgi:hypothetical protein